MRRQMQPAITGNSLTDEIRDGLTRCEQTALSRPALHAWTRVNTPRGYLRPPVAFLPDGTEAGTSTPWLCR